MYSAGDFTNKMIFFNPIEGKNCRGLIALVCGWITLCTGCGQTGQITSAKPGLPAPAPDYSSLESWAAHPAKYDLSDSLPAPYRPLSRDSSVDVFFIHPTSYYDKKAVDSSRLGEETERLCWNASLADPVVNKITDEGSILNQASVFNGYRVFAPRYRQAHIQAFYIPDSLSKPFFDTAYADIRNAFTWYLATENKGRPFIIASHSQGTLHAARLISEMIDGHPLSRQFVAGYLVGLPVRENLFSNIPPCTAPDTKGCIVSWRSFKQGYEPPYLVQENFKAIVVNPLTWTSLPGPVPRKENKGSILYKFNKPKTANVSTVIHGNILWCSKPRFFGNIFFTRKNYHIGDYNLFWKNIRDNAAERVRAYRASNGK